MKRAALATAKQPVCRPWDRGDGNLALCARRTSPRGEVQGKVQLEQVSPLCAPWPSMQHVLSVFRTQRVAKVLFDLSTTDCRATVTLHCENGGR